MAKSNKTKRVSITSLEKIIKGNENQTQTVEWNGLEVTIKKDLSFRETLTFVDSVTKSCFENSSNAYLPEVKMFAIKCCVLEMYANFTLPDNVERKYDLVYNTDAFDMVLQYIDMRQLNEIVDAISDKVDNLAQANIEAVNRQMNELYSAFNTLQERLGSIFNNIDPKDISALVGAISNSHIDEEKLVHAYTNQSKTDEVQNGAQDSKADGE